MGDVELPVLQDQYGQDIKADIEHPIFLKNIIFSRFHDQFGFGVVDEFFRHSKAGTAACFHFYKNEHFALPGNQVNFGMPGAVISFDDLKSFFL